MNFYVLLGISIYVLFVSFGGAWYLRYRSSRFSQLLTSGIEAKGTILESKEYKGQVEKLILIKYEFQTSDGALQKGSQRLPLSLLEKPKEYIIGASTIISYLQNTPAVSSLKNPLNAVSDRAKKSSNTMTFLPIFQIIILIAMWIFLYHKHLVKIPF